MAVSGERFGAIVVTNYLHRPLLPMIGASLGAGGVLIYETFMIGNERYGKPSNPNFLLGPVSSCKALRSHGARLRAGNDERVVQRMCAIRGEASSARIPA